MKPLGTSRAMIVACVGAGLLALTSFSADSPRRAENRVFMREKLAYSQGLLEGLTLEKFDLVSKNALLMRNMTQSNSWYSVRHQDYMTLTTNFYKSVDKLYTAAVDKNLTSATDAYLGVVKQCVECHRLVRIDQRRFGETTPPAKP